MKVFIRIKIGIQAILHRIISIHEKDKNSFYSSGGINEHCTLCNKYSKAMNNLPICKLNGSLLHHTLPNDPRSHNGFPNVVEFLLTLLQAFLSRILLFPFENVACNL